MPAVWCSVSGCYKSSLSRHRFPNPSQQGNETVFAKWVNLCGNRRLKEEMTPDKIYTNCRVCALHFMPQDFGPNKVLKKGVWPSVNLPEPLEPMKESSCPTVAVPSTSALPTGPAIESPRTLKLRESLNAQFEKLRAKKRTVSELSASDCQTSSTAEPELEPLLDVCQTSSVDRPSTPTTSKTKKRSDLLAEVNVSSVKDLTPKARRLYQLAIQFKKRAALSTRNCLSLKKRLDAAKSFTKSDLFEKCVSSMDRIRKRFFESQVENLKRKPKGRRYSLEDKVLALALYKQSGSGYRFLSKLFALPSRKTVMKLLNRIPIRPGIHDEVFAVLKAEAKNFKNPLDKYCVLMFDEISIQPSLQPNWHEGNVTGFEDLGFKQTPEIANHAQVFMLRGIRRKWKQPIYYNFVNGATKNYDVVNILKQIVKKCHGAGLHIVASICDQGSNNQAAINTLVNDTKAKYLRQGRELQGYYFEIGDQKVIPLFDVPHIFKCLRNNFVNYDVSFKQEGITKVAKWEHIYRAYQLDPYLGSFRLMPKLTDTHVNPEKIQKMKVSKCTQVFSHSVASAINVFAFSGTTVTIGDEVVQLETAAADTAIFLEFLDQLFDSLNGSSFKADPGKNLRVAVTNSSPHKKFWEEAIIKLGTVHFRKIRDGRVQNFVPPSLKNLIKTIINFQELWRVVQGLGFSYLMPRTFNQDPLENFFGQIRQRGQRNTNPTPTDFGHYYKSLIVRQLTSSQCVGANCENDNSEVFLTLQRLVTQGLPEDEEANAENFCSIPENVPPSVHPIETQALRYISGYLIKKVGTLPCSCKDLLLKKNADMEESEAFLRAKEYNFKKKSLQYVNSSFLEKIKHAVGIIRYIFNRDLHKKNLVAFTLRTLKNKIKLTTCCHDNRIKKCIFKYLIKIQIFNYTKQINRIIKGLDVRPIPSRAPKFFLAAKKIRNITKLRKNK